METSLIIKSYLSCHSFCHCGTVCPQNEEIKDAPCNGMREPKNRVMIMIPCLFGAVSSQCPGSFMVKQMEALGTKGLPNWFPLASELLPSLGTDMPTLKAQAPHLYRATHVCSWLSASSPHHGTCGTMLLRTGNLDLLPLQGHFLVCPCKQH